MLAHLNKMPSAPVYASLPADFPVGPMPDIFPHFLVDHLTDDNFFDTIANSKADYYIVEFYLHTCPHCQHFALSMERLAMTLQNTHVRVGSIDCLIYPEVCGLYNPPVVPTVMIASIGAWASKLADPAWGQRGWSDSYSDDLDKRIEKVDEARRRILESGTALDEQALAKEARSLLSISPWPSPQAHPYPIILDRDPGLGGIHATMAAINAKVGFEPPLQLVSMTEFQVKWDQFLKTEPNREGLHDSAVTFSRVDNWDVETGTAQAIQFAFLREDINATIRLSLITFLKSLCKAYPDVSTDGKCRASLCDLASRVETKWTQVDPDYPERSGVPPWEILKEKWTMCSRPWEDYTAGFVQCKGSYNRRGHSCSLWSLFHSLVRVDTGSDGGANEKRDYLDRLHAIREYIKWFFNCDECADHFLMITEDYGEIKGKLDGMLYLWRKHNMVNARVFKLESDHGDFDPAFPKVTFPSHAQCPKCYLKEGAVSKDMTIARSASCAQACGKSGEKCHCDPQCELDNDCCYDYYTQCKKEGNPFKTPIEWDEWEVYQFLLDYFEPRPSPATPAVGTVVARLPEYMLVAFDKLAKLKEKLASGVATEGAGGVQPADSSGGRRNKKRGGNKKSRDGNQGYQYQDPRYNNRVDEYYDPRNPLDQYGYGFGGQNERMDPYGYGGHPAYPQQGGFQPYGMNPPQQPYGQVAPWGYQPPPPPPKSLKQQLLEKLLKVGDSSGGPSSSPSPQVPSADMSDLKQQLIDKFLGNQQPGPPPFGGRRGKGGPKGGKRGNDGGGLLDSLRSHFLGGGGGGGGRSGGGWGRSGGRMRGEL